MATNCDLLDSSYNHIDTNNSNNILTTPEFEGVGYAPTFDRLLIYSQDKVKSKNMTALIAWCQDKAVCCWCKLREYWTLGDYKKQLEEKEKQVEILEKKLREAEKKIEEASKSTESKLSLPVPKLSPFHSTSVDPVTPRHPVAPNTSDSVTSTAPTTTLTSHENLNGAPSPIVSIPLPPGQQLGALLPPPPPMGALPPPPPPPPAIKTPTSTKLIITKKKNGNLKPNDQPGLFVTPEALKGIRLRKADNNQQNSKTKDSSTPSGLVTLEQLKTVNLRRTQSAKSLDDVGKENIHQRLAHEMLNRRALKKTTIKRSPGGTPLGDNKQKRESGVGLTPVMTRALKRKFRLAKRESLSSDDGGGSNNSSPDISIYNQTINSSAGDLSWSSPTDSPTNFSFCRDVRSPLSDRLSMSPNITTSSPNLS